MMEVRNPVYIYDYDDSWKSGHPMAQNVLERPPVPSDADSRLTAQGAIPPVSGLTPIVAMAGQTPYNIWGLTPA